MSGELQRGPHVEVQNVGLQDVRLRNVGLRNGVIRSTLLGGGSCTYRVGSGGRESGMPVDSGSEPRAVTVGGSYEGGGVEWLDAA